MAVEPQSVPFSRLSTPHPHAATVKDMPLSPFLETWMGMKEWNPSSLCLHKFIHGLWMPSCFLLKSRLCGKLLLRYMILQCGYLLAVFSWLSTFTFFALPLSLYSTGNWVCIGYKRQMKQHKNMKCTWPTQKGGFALGDAKNLRHPTQKIPTCWYICVRWRKSTQREWFCIAVEYRLYTIQGNYNLHLEICILKITFYEIVDKSLSWIPVTIPICTTSTRTVDNALQPTKCAIRAESVRENSSQQQLEWQLIKL